MIQRALEQQFWQKLYPGSYLAGPRSPVWITKEAGAVLAGGFQCVASHRAAGRLLGLDGCDLPAVEITTTRSVRWRGVIVHRRKAVLRQDVTTVQNVRTTTATKTLLELGSVVDLFRLEAALDSALLQGLTSVDYLQRSMVRTSERGRRGLSPLRKLLEVRLVGQPPTESELERLFDRRITRGLGLPQPVCQYPVDFGDGTRARLDFAYPTLLVGIEVVGWRFHQGRRRWQRDLERHNRLSDRGWLLLYFTWADVQDRPRFVAAQIRSVLASRENVLFPFDNPGGCETRKEQS